MADKSLENELAQELDQVVETLRDAYARLEQIGGETAGTIRRRLGQALSHAPDPAPSSDVGDFAPGTTVGDDDDNLRRTQALEGEQPGGAPSSGELLQENARLQERVAQLEAQNRGNG